jgi:cell division protein FtsB
MNKASGTRQGDATATGVRGLLEWTYEHRRRFATVGAAALALGFGYHVVFGQNGLTAYEQKRHEVRALNQQLKDLADENERLKGHVERLQDDPGAIEAAAREELHYTRPGEVIVTLPNEKPSASADSK